jgi:hypothetical protein
MFSVTSSPVDAAALSHQVAIIDEFEHPLVTDWFSGTWVDDEVQVLVRASADAPAGGDIELDVGRWRVWWKASANPEYPARQVGIVSVV